MQAVRAAVALDDVPALRAALAALPASDSLTQPADGGPTPLHWAASHAHARCVAELLAAPGGDWGVVSMQADGKSPLHLAARAGSGECVRLLLEGRPPRVKARMVVAMRDESGMTALLYGAMSQSPLGACAPLLEGSDAVDDRSPAQECTALHLAALKGDGELCALLLSAGADVDARDKAQRTPLICAAIEGFDPVVAVLVRAGAALELVDGDGSSAGDWARMLENAACEEAILGPVPAQDTAANEEPAAPGEAVAVAEPGQGAAALVEAGADAATAAVDAALAAAEAQAAALALHEAQEAADAARAAADEEAVAEAARVAAEEEAAAATAAARVAAEERAAAVAEAEEPEAERLSAAAGVDALPGRLIPASPEPAQVISNSRASDDAERVALIHEPAESKSCCVIS